MNLHDFHNLGRESGPTWIRMLAWMAKDQIDQRRQKIGPQEADTGPTEDNARTLLVSYLLRSLAHWHGRRRILTAREQRETGLSRLVPHLSGSPQRTSNRIQVYSTRLAQTR
jgi:hypothetical protein